MNRIVAGFTGIMMAAATFAAQQAPATAKTETPPSLELTGSVQIQAQKAFWDNVAVNKKKDNLDDFWGRGNFGAKFKASDFSSELNIRAFPEGWGYEPLTGLTVKDSTDTISLSTTKTQIAKFLIEQAWVKYAFPMVDVRVGRYNTTLSKTVTSGNFLDQDPGMSFQGKLAYHNAVDLTLKTGIASTNILLGATDQKLNTGYLRIWESVAYGKNFTAGAGYRANVFDLARNPDAKVDHRADLCAEYAIMPEFKPYIEAGLINKTAAQGVANQEDTLSYPLLIGTTIPTAGFLNALNVEIEYVDGRQVKDVKTGVKKDSPLMIGIYADKKLSARARFQLSLFSDASGTSAGNMRFGLRFTSALK